MRAFAIYSLETGLIAQINGADDTSSIEPILGVGQALAEVPLGTSDALYYIDDGSPVLLPAKPIYPCSWDPTTKQWLDSRDIVAVRLDQWKMIKRLRDAAIVEPKMTSLGAFDANLASQVNLANVIALTQIASNLGMPAQANYTLADNSRVTLTLVQLQTAALEIGSQVQALYDRGDELRQAIEAATSVADVTAIEWT